MAQRRAGPKRDNRCCQGEGRPDATEALAPPNTPLDKRLRRAEAQRRRLLHRIAKRQSEINELRTASVRCSADDSLALVSGLTKRQRTLRQLQEALTRCLERTDSLSARQHAFIRRAYAPVLREISQALTANEPQDAATTPRSPTDPKQGLPSAASTARSPQELKSVYLDLVAALHPDLEADEHRREQRTEALKQVNQAYASGDAASLLRLHSGWQVARVSRKSSAARLAECENENRYLLKQLRELTARRKPLRQASNQVPLTLHQLHTEQRTLDELLSAARGYLAGSVEAEQFLAFAREQWTNGRD